MRPMLAIALAAMLQGCAATDPQLDRTAWQPVGANTRNIAAQVANPMDLVRGRSSAGSDGTLAADAVARLRTGHVKALPDSSISDLKIQVTETPASPP